jgi:hypothetical protein
VTPHVPNPRPRPRRLAALGRLTQADGWYVLHDRSPVQSLVDDGYRRPASRAGAAACHRPPRASSRTRGRPAPAPAAGQTGVRPAVPTIRRNIVQSSELNGGVIP